jgi:hypothetical protein
MASTAALLLLLTSPATASAQPAVPGAELVPIPGSPFPAGELCDFPVAISAASNVKIHDVNGVILATGPAVARVTNTSSGATQDINISGPTQINRTTGTIVAGGAWLILQPASAGLGDPFLITNNGRIEFAPNGTIASRTGSRTDLCAQLG